MSYCIHIDPKSNARSMGRLNEHGECVLLQDSRLDHFLLQDTSPGVFKIDPKILQIAPAFFIPQDCDLATQDLTFSTRHKQTQTLALRDAANMDFYGHVTTAFQGFDPQVLESFIPEEAKAMKAKYHPEEDVEETIEVVDFYTRSDEIVRKLRRHFKVMIPFLPQLSHFISMRPSIYLLHMLWYIREYQNPMTGVAQFRGGYMSYYLAMSARTEQRLRNHFVDKRLFDCTYDRKKHILNISVNWEGLDAFLMALHPSLTLFPPKKVEKVTCVEAPAQEDSPPTQPAKKEPFELVGCEKSVFKWFEPYLHKELFCLSQEQIQAAVLDLGVVSLMCEKAVKRGFQYLVYAPEHPLRPYFNAAGTDCLFVLEAILRACPALIPNIRPIEECPDYYFKGDEEEAKNGGENPLWSPREKVTYAFTKRISFLMGFESYAVMAGHMSIAEWNINGAGIPEFLIITRNAPMAAILGVFFSHLMHRFKDNFRYHLIPLEDRHALDETPAQEIVKEGILKEEILKEETFNEAVNFRPEP